MSANVCCHHQSPIDPPRPPPHRPSRTPPPPQAPFRQRLVGWWGQSASKPEGSPPPPPVHQSRIRESRQMRSEQHSPGRYRAPHSTPLEQCALHQDYGPGQVMVPLSTPLPPVLSVGALLPLPQVGGPPGHEWADRILDAGVGCCPSRAPDIGDHRCQSEPAGTPAGDTGTGPGRIP